VSLFFGNPELIRNARIQLRTGRLVVGALVAAIASVVVWESVMHANTDFGVCELSGTGAIFALALLAQAAILEIGGGIACLLSVQREKELNTFDFQRLTRLSPLELAAGKLLGAPIGMYAGVLLLMPVALLAAARAHFPPLFVLKLYVIVLVGSLTFHAFALLISTLLGRSGIVLAIFLFVSVVLISVKGSYGTIENLSPFCVVDALTTYGFLTHQIHAPTEWVAWQMRWVVGRDFFFGIPIPHLAVFAIIHATLTAWFLTAVRRNLKRDPSLYEVYSPVQALAFALCICALLIGGFPWKALGPLPISIRDARFALKPAIPNSVEQSLLQASILIFGPLGLTLLRNRERTRRRVRKLGETATGWVAALWPAPFICLATAAFGGTVIFLIDRYRSEASEWNLHLAIYEAAFMGVWLARDSLYVQWMGVRRSRRAFLSAFLYPAIFYTAVGIMFAVMDVYRAPRRAAYTALVFPTPIFGLNMYSWGQERNHWIGALLFQIGTVILFAGLHRQRLQELIAASRPTNA
jgi:hypothetical protein